MKRKFWRYFQNLKNKIIFGHFGKGAYIYPGVQVVRPRSMSVGNRVLIGGGTLIYAHPEQNSFKKFIIEIGDHVHIGANCIIGARCSVVIEAQVLLGPHVMIGDHSHLYEDVDIPIKLQGVTEGKPIRIERDSWIGANVFILPGVVIGRHSVIGANSVVNRDIPAYSVAVGAPAKVIKQYHFELKRWVRVKNGKSILEQDFSIPG